jgi:asparagine N-glycosylation enzyme membrane subunit Stt3
MKLDKSSFEKSFRFFNDHKSWLIYSILVLIILLGIFIRMQPIDNLFDPTIGKYITIELDSTLFLRYAYNIASGSLSSIDMLRSAPLGQPVGFYGMFTSYFVAYLWEFLHIFNDSITVEYVDVIYPVIAMALMTLFLFLLLRRLLEWKTALLSSLLISIIPAFLFRSLGGSSDHDILGMMLMFASFYLYFVAYQSKKLKFGIVFGILAGIITFLANATFGSSIFILTIIGSMTLILFLLNNFSKENLIVYTSWFLTFNLCLLIFGVSIYGFIISVSTMIVYFVFLILIIHYILFTKQYIKVKFLEKIKLSNSIVSLIIAILIGFIFLLMFSGFDVIVSSLVRLYDYLFHAFQYSRIGLTVAENRKPYIVDWFSQFGTLYVLLFISGAIILFYKMVRYASKLKKNLTVVFAIFLILYLFSRYAPNTLLDGESLFSKVLFFGSVIFFIAYLLYTYFYTYYKDKETFEEFSKFDFGAMFLLIWFLIMTIGATTAIRLFNEFAPTTVIIASVALVFFFDYFWRNKNNYIKYFGVTVIVLVLFSPFSFAKGIAISAYESSYSQAKYSGPGYDQQWQLAGKWVRENTNKTDVFVHWWDYGYWVQSGFERPTVTDGGHPYGWWDYLVARDVLTTPNLETPLKFLKAHNVSYLLIVKDEIGKYTAYSSIGGDINNDRVSYISTFMLNPQATQEKRNTTIITYQGQFVLDEDFIYNGKVYSQGNSAILAVNLILNNLTQENGKLSFGFEQPYIILYSKTYQPQQLRLQCVYVNDQEYLYTDYDFPGCFRVMPTYSNGQQSPIGSGLFLSERVYSSLFAKLYLLNKNSSYYKLVYSDDNNAPLALYNGNLIGPIRIWKINYPESLALTQEELYYNLMTTYPDESLVNPY